MKVEDVKPAHCYARARQMLADVKELRAEMGRAEDARPVPEVSDAEPRECYGLAIATWHKAARVADELGVRSTRPAPAMPTLSRVAPGHVLQLLEAIAMQIDDISARLAFSARSGEQPIEHERKPSDVLATLFRINRELSRMLQRPFTPGDVHHVVALASAYAERLGARAPTVAFEPRKLPADCYRQLDACLARAAALLHKRGVAALALHGAPADVTPGDVYDLASLVLVDVACVHSHVQTAAPVYAIEPGAHGYRLPSHVLQLARTLDAQLAAIA
jgi:hypothetical protein